MVEASHVGQAATPSLKQHRYLAEEFILAAPYNSKGEKSSADVMKGGAYKSHLVDSTPMNKPS
ncbi:hypothetical protein T09_13045 [Trichinella sp. T9]|nr:hypothetical protein T09_13045 [Trichinella sp. T9]